MKTVQRWPQIPFLVLRSSFSASSVTRNVRQISSKSTTRSGFSSSSLVLIATLTGIASFFGAKTMYESSPRSASIDRNWIKRKYGGETEVQKALPEFVAAIGAENVSIEEEVVKTHGYSQWSSYNIERNPLAVVYPSSTEDVSAIAKICHKYRLPMIPYSAGSSIEGQLCAPYGGVCIDFLNMDKVIAVRPDDLDCTLQPGVNWMQLNEVLKQDKLFFPVDPGPTAKIGGMVGTNCSGTNAYRYGPMRDYVINMTVVLADGSIVKTRRRPRKSSAGYNLNHLFCGSEGTLGLITEVTVKLEVLPEMSRVAICSFPTIRDATDTAASLVKAGIKVGALELMDDVQMKAVNDSGLTTRKWDVMPTLFFKFAGTSPSVKEQADKAQDIAKLNNSRNFVFARSDKESDELWSARKQLLWTMMAVGPEDSIFYSTDVAVPLSRLAEMVEQSKKDILDSGIFGSCLGHVGDGNFHSCILYREEESGKFIALKKKIIERGLAMEGTCTGEHGIGASKVKELGMELGSETLSLMRTIKLAVDPHELMNPGKIFTKESIEHTIQNERINVRQNSNTL